MAGRTISTPMAATPTTRQRVPAAERRDALIDAAVIEFGHSGLHGTPVDRIARRVGVAQPYVFSLFGNKRDLFLAAVTRSFERFGQTFALAAEQYRAGALPDCEDMLQALGTPGSLYANMAATSGTVATVVA